MLLIFVEGVDELMEGYRELIQNIHRGISNGCKIRQQDGFQTSLLLGYSG